MNNKANLYCFGISAFFAGFCFVDISILSYSLGAANLFASLFNLWVFIKANDANVSGEQNE